MKIEMLVKNISVYEKVKNATKMANMCTTDRMKPQEDKIYLNSDRKKCIGKQIANT